MMLGTSRFFNGVSPQKKNSPSAPAPHTPKPKPKPEDDDIDEYGSFDESELDIINALLDAHSKPPPPSPLPLPFTPPPTYVPTPIYYPDLSKYRTEEPFDFTSYATPPVSDQVSSSPTQRPSSASEGNSKYRNGSGSSFAQSQLGKHSPQSHRLRNVSDGPTRSVLEIQYESSQLGTRRPTTAAGDFAKPSADPSDAPYDRFRGNTKGLSVTDLLSSTWCEQQFEFYLTRGRKRRTAAMKAGTKIHQTLEREIQVPISIDIVSREDRWGLRLLNTIQGLRTLRERGITRELPVFAFVKGMFVQGVIDEITYSKPVTGMFEEDEAAPKQEPHDDEDQPLITKYLMRRPTCPTEAYISDCKTRVKPTLPPASQLRGTKVQLMLYHYLVRSMAISVAATVEHYMAKVTPDPHVPEVKLPPPTVVPPDHLMTQLFLAQNLDPHARFSDRFLQQIAPLVDESDSEGENFGSEPGIRYPSFSDILADPTLVGLLTILSTSFTLALPRLSDSLFVSYRSQEDSRLFATLEVPFDEQVLDEHLVDVLHWWKGERKTEGVPIEEAWKCRSCEFADTCEWRLGKIDELKAKKDAEREAFVTQVKKEGK